MRKQRQQQPPPAWWDAPVVDAPDSYVELETGCGVARVYSCGCIGGHVSGETFYTSARREDGRAVALSGPYLHHGTALRALPGDRQWAQEVSGDPRAEWYAYGTFSTRAGAEVKVFRLREVREVRES